MKNKLNHMSKTEQLLGWPYYVIQLLFLPTIIVFIDFWFKLQLNDAMLNIIMFTVNFMLIALIFHKYLFSQLRIAGANIGKVLVTAVFGFVLYITLNYVISFAILFLNPQHINANNEAIDSMADQHYLLMTLGTVLLVPITEETLYRGLIFGTIYRKNAVLGYILSTVIFSAVHVVGYIGLQDTTELLISFVQYLPAGLALGWAYARSGTIWTPILIHAAVNWIGMAAMR